MLTDISSEMITAILPLYLTLKLSFSTVQFGGFVALSEAAQAAMRIGSGFLADRTRRHKDVAVAGYAASAVTRIGVLAAGGAWVPTTGVLLVDRVGKGIRTAPRDAMISLASPPALLGRSFGVHRALDAAGALAGPLIAFAVLAIAADAYESVFLVSFAFAIVGVAVIVLFVPRQEGSVSIVPVRIGDALGDSNVRRLAGAAAVLGLVTIGDAFVFLSFRRVSEIELRFFPLLFTGSALVYLVLAVPVGWMSDVVDHRYVIATGHAMLGLVYLVLLTGTSGVFGAFLVVVGLGAFYACTDGVLAAMVSGSLPGVSRATGLAIFATAAAVGRGCGAFAFGWLWSTIGPQGALRAGALATLPAVAVAWWCFRPRPSDSAVGSV